MRSLLALFVSILVVPVGCVDDPGARSGVIMRDSAGIQVIESQEPRDSVLAWRLSAEPALTIGEVEGDDAQLLNRVFSADVLPDRRIVLSNSGSHEVRIYSPSGVLETTFGREGQGPGEFGDFSSMRLLATSADTIAVSDERLSRVHIFDTGGAYVRTLRPVVVDGFGRPGLHGRFSTGEWLGFMPVGTGALSGDPGDLIRSEFGFLVYEPGLSTARELGRVAGRPRVVNELGGGSIHFPFIPLTPEPIFAVRGEFLYLNVRGTTELREIAATGELTRIIRWRRSRTPTGDIWARFSEEFLQEVSEDRRPAYARLLDRSGIPIPDSVPALSEVVVDDLGHIWAQHYRLPWTAERRWSVFDPEGRWLGDIVTPERLTVFAIGQDYVMGRHVDDLGVERLMLYDLAR